MFYDKNYYMLVIRILPNDDVSLSHPCALCAEALGKSPIGFIIYTIDNENCNTISSRNISKHHISRAHRTIKS